MSQFKLASKCFVFLAEALILCLVLGSQIVFSQPEEKFSVENKILQEKPPASVAYSALAPESIFSNPEVAGAFYEQAKSLIQTLAESELEDAQQELIAPREPLSASRSFEDLKPPEHFIRQKELKQVREEIIVLQKGMTPAQARDIPKPFFLEMTRENTLLQLIHHNDLQGTINTLSYERIEGRGIRFRYTQIPEDFIGHFWWFEPKDLRGKTVRIYYSGIVPSEITFLVRRSYWGVEAAFRFHLEDSPETKILSFQIPDRIPFKEVSIFELRIEKARAGKPYGDFLIEKVEVAPGDKASTPIEMGNQSHPFPFGGPYLQSNIWGGEVKAS